MGTEATAGVRALTRVLYLVGGGAHTATLRSDDRFRRISRYVVVKCRESVLGRRVGSTAWDFYVVVPLVIGQVHMLERAHRADGKRVESSEESCRVRVRRGDDRRVPVGRVREPARVGGRQVDPRF